MTLWALTGIWVNSGWDLEILWRMTKFRVTLCEFDCIWAVYLLQMMLWFVLINRCCCQAFILQVLNVTVCVRFSFEASELCSEDIIFILLSSCHGCRDFPVVQQKLASATDFTIFLSCYPGCYTLSLNIIPL